MNKLIQKHMKKYILIQPDEDGNPITWLQSEELENIHDFMIDYGIKKFLDHLPAEQDPQYWEDGEAMLLEVEIKQIVPVKVVEKYEIK